MIRAQNWCHSAVSVDSYIICAHDPDWWNWRWGEGLLRAHSRHSGFWIYVHCPSGFVWSSQLQSRPSISLHGRLKEIICAIAYRVWINPMWMLVFLVPTEEKLRTPSFTLSSHTDSSLLASQVLRVTHYMALISLWWNFAKTAFGFYSREDFFQGHWQSQFLGFSFFPKSTGMSRFPTSPLLFWILEEKNHAKLVWPLAHF